MALVEFRNYSFTYLKGDRKSLENVNLTIERGTATGIIGPAGSGKSTLIMAMAGVIPEEVPGYQEGDIIIAGKNAKELDVLTFAQDVGVVLQNPETQLLGLTVLDDIALGPSNLGVPQEELHGRIEYALSMSRLTGLEKRNPEELSGGQQQSLAIADILAMKPKILAMDRPVAMLDPEGKYRVITIMKSLVDRGGTTLVVTDSGRDIDAIAEYLDRIIVMDKGKIVLEGKPGEVLADPVLDQIGVGRPQVTDLFLKLREHVDVPRIPYTLSDATELVKGLAKGKILSVPHLQSGGLDTKPIISIQNLEHIYPPDVKALRGVSLDIREGEIVGLIGQNGSGKTTLCLHMVGVLKPSNPQARVIVDGLDVSSSGTREVIQHVNYVFQNPNDQLFQERVDAELAYGPKLIGMAQDEVARRVEETIKTFGLEAYKEAYVAELPQNVKSMVAIASVAIMRPKVLILDEPTGSMDKIYSTRFVELMKHFNRKTKLTIIVVTHAMDLIAELCNKVVVMLEGKVLTEGTPGQVFSRPELLAQTNLRPPQITQLSQSLGELGFPKDVTTVNEFMQAVLPSIQRKEGH